MTAKRNTYQAAEKRGISGHNITGIVLTSSNLESGFEEQVGKSDSPCCASVSHQISHGSPSHITEVSYSSALPSNLMVGVLLGGLTGCQAWLLTEWVRWV